MVKNTAIFLYHGRILWRRVVALMDFAIAYPVKIEFYARQDNQQGNPRRMFGKLRATEMSVPDRPRDQSTAATRTEIDTVRPDTAMRLEI